MDRNLEITIKLDKADGLPVVEIYEPDSGDFHRSTVDPDVLQEKGLKGAIEDMFAKKVGDELYGWYIGLVEDLEFQQKQQKQEENYVVLWVDEDNGDRDTDGRVIGGYEAGYHADYECAVKQAKEDISKIKDREIVVVKADDFHKNSSKAPLNILWTNKKELQMERPTLDMMTDFKGAGYINLSKSEPLMVEPDHINACYELWFDVDKVFGTDTMGNDSTVEFYTNYYPESGKFECEVVVVGTDGTTTCPEYKMTDKEMAFLKGMMEEEAKNQGFASLDDMFVLENELEEKEQ